MSIEHQPPVEKGNEVTDQPLQVYLLNGQEVQLTSKQADMLGAQKIGHSGDLGLEAPAEGAIPITHDMHAHPDDMPQSPVFNPKDKKQARELQKKNSKFPLWAKLGAGGLALSTAVGVGAVVHTAVKANNALEDIADQNTSAPEIPGASEDPEPVSEQLDPPEWEAFDLTYEEAIEPAQLTDEQLAAWNSGDTQTQNEIVDQVLRDRTSYALTDLQRTQGTDQVADISYVTRDPAVVDSLNWAVSQLPEASEVNGISVCPLDASDYGFTQMCYPSHLDTPVNFAPQPGDSAVIYVNVIDDANTFGENPDLFKGFNLDIHPEVDSEGILTWVHNQ